MKKIICIALALVMILGLAVSVSAYDITVSDSASGATVAGHTYNVYQIFKGDLEELGNEKVLTNIVYGQNYGTEDEKVPQDALEELAAMSGKEAAAALNAAKTGEPVAVLNDENDFTATEMPVGYYLIVDVTEDLPENETESAFILEVTDDVVIKSKHTEGPEIGKKIDDANDSVDTGRKIEWHDSADHDIGDKIDFQLKMTVPSAFTLFADHNESLAEGEERIPYRFVFHDTEEKGFTFLPSSVKVYLNGEELTSGYEVDTTIDSHTFDVIFEDLTAIEGVEVGSVITVEYQSELNEDAVLGSMGNVNRVFGEFRNFYKPETPVFTPEDTVIAFTYKVVINKVDKDKEPLSGATFTLEKYIADTDEWKALTTVETKPDTVFTFSGLDDGKYRLTETEAPDGYNKIDPIEFTVTAKHEIEWETGVDRTDILTTLTGEVETGEITFTADKTAGSLTSDVINQAGATLPETGGIGTTIFYCLGAALAICAAVVLVTRRRMSAQD